MKSEKGSVTLFVLVAMIFFLGIAMTAYITATSKLQGQSSELAQIKASYGQNISQEGLENLYENITKTAKVDENGCYLITRTIDGKTASSTNPIIPAGFKPVDTNATVWGGGEQAPTIANVNEGLVIEDKDGNQFVWVPVDGTNIKYEQHTYSNDESYSSYSDWTDTSGNEASVGKYGGFYIARYEAGIPQNAEFYNNADNTQYITAREVTTYMPVSKANQPVWNFISQQNAEIVASKMYNINSVRSGLVDSFAWDTVTTWIEKNGKDVTNSTTWGNYLNASYTINGLHAVHTFNDFWNYATIYNKKTYSVDSGIRIETATGITDRNKANNIYDFAGNVSEWTTETGNHEGTGTRYAVARGGSFDDNGEDAPAAYRYGNIQTTYNNVNYGFRVVLYVN